MSEKPIVVIGPGDSLAREAVRAIDKGELPVVDVPDKEAAALLDDVLTQSEDPTEEFLYMRPRQAYDLSSLRIRRGGGGTEKTKIPADRRIEKRRRRNKIAAKSRRRNRK